MTAAIIADGLTKWYGPRRAVEGVSLAVNPGEVMGLLGPNGSGKTTILRILAGYLAPSAGRASIAGFDTVTGAMEARRRVGYVPEDAPLYEGMRVREFLAFMAAIKGLAPAAARAAGEVACARLALEAVRDLPIRTLSKGYRQRVSIAQALLNEPPVLILDEPTNGLDPRQIIEMRNLIRALAGAHAILVSSHVLPEMERIADRVAILVDGRLLDVHTVRHRTQGRRLRLRVGGDPDRVARCLAAVPGVRRLDAGAISRAGDPGGVSRAGGPGVDSGAAAVDGEREDARTYVVDIDPTTPADRVAAAVVGAGLPLAELREEPVDLEALFLQLTGAHRGAPGPPEAIP
jgi:ABC-2 type transport system ATP-binding protein